MHTDKTPIHGTGQGSCASPAIWLLVSSILMEILQQSAKGMSMQGIEESTRKIVQWIEGYVDDTSIFTYK
jgi:hypothetical protein